MSKFFHLAKKMNNRPAAARARQRTANPKMLRFGVGTMVTVMLVAYIMQVNAIATKGYHIKELQGTIDDLRRQHDELRAEATRLQSMAAVKDRVGNLEMVSANDADYVAPTPVAVAR